MQSVHSFIHSFNCLFDHSFVHSFIHSFIHSSNNSNNAIHSIFQHTAVAQLGYVAWIYKTSKNNILVLILFANKRKPTHWDIKTTAIMVHYQLLAMASCNSFARQKQKVSAPKYVMNKLWLGQIMFSLARPPIISENMLWTWTPSISINQGSDFCSTFLYCSNGNETGEIPVDCLNLVLKWLHQVYKVVATL